MDSRISTSSHQSNIRQRLSKRSNEPNREISKSAHNLLTSTAVNRIKLNHQPEESDDDDDDDGDQNSNSFFDRHKSAAELLIDPTHQRGGETNSDEAPVLRRRRFTRKNRKSLIIEPDTGIILATASNNFGCGRQRENSTSSDEDTNMSSTTVGSINFKNRYRSHEKGPAARRANRLSKRNQQYASSTTHLNLFDNNNMLQNQKRSLSVRDLNGESIDFTNRESVTKWTSQILAELDSLPSSCMNLAGSDQPNKRFSMQVCSSPNFEKNLTDVPTPSPSFKIKKSIIDEQNGIKSMISSTTSLPIWNSETRERENSCDSIGTSTLVMQSSSDSNSDNSECEVEDTFEASQITTPKCSSPNMMRKNEEQQTRQNDIIEKLEKMSKPDFLRYFPSNTSPPPPPPPPHQPAPPIPAKRTQFQDLKLNEEEIGSSLSSQKIGVRKRFEEVFNEADRKLQNSISRMSQSVYGDLKQLKNSSRFSIPIIRTSSDSPNSNILSENMMKDEKQNSLDKWKKMAECRARKETGSTSTICSSSNLTFDHKKSQKIGEAKIEEKGGEKEEEGEDKPSVSKALSALIKTVEASRFSASDRPKDISIQKSNLMDFLSQDAGTQTTPFAASRSSSFDWINDPTENCLREIQTPLTTPKAEELRASKPFTESSSDEADREVAAIASQTEERIKTQKMIKEMDEGIALLLEYGEPSAVKLHQQIQEQQLQNKSPLPSAAARRSINNHYDTLPTTTKFRNNIGGGGIVVHRNRGGQTINSIYDNMPWDKKRHSTSKPQFSPLILTRNLSNQSSSSSASNQNSKEQINEEVEEEEEKEGKNQTSDGQNNNEISKKLTFQFAERDANEACAWLKQAGFPQYVKQFEEGKFPIDTSIVERDHGFLGKDPLRALFRRIDTLNRCAIMKVDNVVMRRRMQNNDYLYGGYDEEDNVALSGNWRFQRQSQTWNRIPANESIYAGAVGGHNSRVVSTKPNWQMSYVEKQNGGGGGGVGGDRHVSRTNWYEAQETRGRQPSIVEHQTTKSSTLRIPKSLDSSTSTSTIVCVNGGQSTSSTSTDSASLTTTTTAAAAAAAAKLQRSQSEKIKDRARAVLKRINPRSASKKRRESRHQDSPTTNSHNLIIGDPVLVSYDTSTMDSRILNSSRPMNLTDRGRSLYPTSNHLQSSSRSKSARRQGIVLLTPSSPDSSDDSFGGTSTTSAQTSSSLIGGSMTRRRESSMPPPSVRRTPIPNFGEHPRAPTNQQVLPVQRRRIQNASLSNQNPSPFDAYLYPSSPNSLTRPNRNTGLTRIVPEFQIPSRDYGGLLQRSDRQHHNLVISNDGYRLIDYSQHELSPDLVRRRIIDSPSTSHSSSHLKVDTQKSESSVDQTDEENLLSTLNRRRDSGVGSSLSRSPSGPSNQRIRQSILQYSLPLLTNSMTLSSNGSNASSGSWQNLKKRANHPMTTSMSSATSAVSAAIAAAAAAPTTNCDETFFTDVEMARSMDSLNIIEMTRLRKLAYLQVTAILEKSMGCSAGKIGGAIGQSIIARDCDEAIIVKNNNNWSVQKLIKKMKISDGKSQKDGDDNGVFGLSLDTIYRRTGNCLPRSILEILRFLRQMAPETVGIFRKNGVKSRIAELRAIADRDPSPMIDVFVGDNSLDSGQVHDVADLLKQYLRDLPEPLMTIKMSEIFANIFTFVPEVDRLSAVQYALLLMPDENREAVQTLMMFLHDVARNSQVNNMTAQNLAVCFTPSLFQLSASRLDKITSGSPNRRHKTIGASGMPSEKEMKETRACQQCLTMLIEYSKTIFMAPDCVDDRNEFEDDIPALKDLGLKGPRSFLIDRVLDMIKDHSERWKGWMLEGTYCGVEITSKKAIDSHPLKTFRVWIDVEAAPKIVMGRIMKERHVWDTKIINWRHIEYVHAPDTDIHQYVINETISHPTKDCHLVRFHSSGLTEIRGACAIAERSVQCSETQMLGGISAIVLDQRFLIEPKSGGQSRITYIARVDLKGRTWQWYNKVYGTIMSRQMLRLRESFQSDDNAGPETKI